MTAKHIDVLLLRTVITECVQSSLATFHCRNKSSARLEWEMEWRGCVGARCRCTCLAQCDASVKYSCGERASHGRARAFGERAKATIVLSMYFCARCCLHPIAHSASKSVMCVGCCVLNTRITCIRLCTKSRGGSAIGVSFILSPNLFLFSGKFRYNFWLRWWVIFTYILFGKLCLNYPPDNLRSFSTRELIQVWHKPLVE